MAQNSFWIDHDSIFDFGRRADTPPLRQGTIWLYLDAKQTPAIEPRRGAYPSDARWIRRYCEIRGSFLFYGPHSDAAYDGAFFLESRSFKVLAASRGVTLGLVTSLPEPPKKGLRSHQEQGVLLVGISNPDGGLSNATKPLIMQFDSKPQALSWKADIERCNVAVLQAEVRDLQGTLEAERQTAKREQKARELIYVNQELEIKKIENTKRTLLLEIERLEQRAQRLQASGEVTEKAAAEFVDQKVNEVVYLQKELGSQVAGCRRLKKEVSDLRGVLSTCQHKVQTLTTENAKLSSKMVDLLKDLEDAKDHPSRFALLMSRLRNINERVAIDNRRLRDENRELTENFHKLEDKYKEKILSEVLRNALEEDAHLYDNQARLVIEMAERGDVFDFLKAWLICSEHKIRYYEQAYKMTDTAEVQEKRRIEELQSEVRVAEAAARSSYIAHRSYLLGEQLKAYTINSPLGDIFKFLKKTLDRFGWLFGDIEPYQPADENGNALPFWKDIDNQMAPIPLQEYVYPFGGLEGGAQLSLVPDVSVLKPVEKLIPMDEFIRLRNERDLLQLDYAELRDVHQQTVDKLMEYRNRLKNLRTQ